MKIAVVIPGFMQHVESSRGSRIYQPLLHDLREAGYKVVPIQVTWERRTFDDWLPEVEKQVAGVQTEDALLIGFSYGAMLSSVLATRHKFARVFLCSLSPYFAEDLRRATKAWHSVGHRRISAFEKVHFEDIVKKYNADQTIVFAGEVEMLRRKAPVLAERNKEAAARLPNAQFIAVPKAAHDISHPNYAAAIKAQL
jgi:pimeloyl-ACP methyl ester carboxylesterase